ncbi:hypothetical protein H3Z85_13805 [Chryseobacterium indologenes]|uniref:Uncharacterized protein n=2 Tax=Chryseobacterium indologenes TaxID=253 RepID=A0AAD0YZQ1_CHRID|nr:MULTISPECIES: hypothetical protein [Chryseobacterium]ASE60193.1 hypothetical protein CEQ15_01005 [Chryseobacterium indologenes]ATN04370.1 hypothetical protein CRN76_02575 [Chryseobacterium indologenes]AYY86880.1 hypothetical protein EGX91_21185 [Chryseobacterium indologenes]AYZ36771.1 hypothetical protein EGY07_14935 [Chryseobacterium indologenes]AZB20092.1 hypothetical protein EG352_21245 [Chryseobacterium indologenes]
MKNADLKNKLNLKGKRLTSEQLKTVLGGISEFDCAYKFDFTYVQSYMNELRAEGHSDVEAIAILRGKLLACGIHP